MAFFGNFALANRPPKPFFGRGGQACRIISDYEMGRHQEAVEACREALRLKPDDAMAWHKLGVSYGELGRWQEAVEAYREPVRLKPDFALAWGNLALAYFLSGNRSAALEAVKELRRHDPQKADELFNLIMKP